MTIIHYGPDSANCKHEFKRIFESFEDTYEFTGRYIEECKKCGLRKRPQSNPGPDYGG